jgi:hypothetical protein
MLSGTGAHDECATFDVWVEAFVAAEYCAVLSYFYEKTIQILK